MHVIFGDHFLYSHDLNVQSSSDIKSRNKKPVTISGQNCVLISPLLGVNTEINGSLLCRFINYSSSYKQNIHVSPQIFGLVSLFL